MMTYEKQENNYIWARFKAGQHLSGGEPGPVPPSSPQRVRREWKGKKWEREVIKKMSALVDWREEFDRDNQMKNSPKLSISWGVQEGGEACMFRKKHVCEATWGKAMLAMNIAIIASLLLVSVAWPTVLYRRIFQVLSNFLHYVCLCANQKPLCQLASRHWTKQLSWQAEQQQQKLLTGLDLSCPAVIYFLPFLQIAT